MIDLLAQMTVQEGVILGATCLGAGIATAVTLASGSNVTYVAYNTTNWEVK